MQNNAGTKAFTAPEGWTRNFKGKPLDMWAAGITLYNMAFGSMPFFSKSQIHLKNIILTEEYTFIFIPFRLHRTSIFPLKE